MILSPRLRWVCDYGCLGADRNTLIEPGVLSDRDPNSYTSSHGRARVRAASRHHSWANERTIEPGALAHR